MAVDSIFTFMNNTFLGSFGTQNVVWVAIAILIFITLIVIARNQFYIVLMLTALPFTLATVMLGISFGFALGIIVFLAGLLLFVGLRRLIFR